MKYIFVINSFTIGDRLDKLVKKIEKTSKKFKLDYVIEINNKNYSTEDILNKYKDGKNVIMAVGGDGMINRVLNGIVNTKNILGFIPYGTGNDLYKTALRSLDELTKCDIVKINDRYFINVACFGIDAEVANNNNYMNSKYIPKNLKYIFSLIDTFFKYKNRDMKVIINGKTIDNKFATIAVCNASFYGNGFMIGPNSSVTDGLIDVYYAKDLTKWNILKLILKLKRGKHESSKDITKIKTEKLAIESLSSINCNIDGELLCDNKFNIEVIKNGITLYFNKELIKEILK